MAGESDDIKSKIKLTEQLTAAIEKQQRRIEASTRALTAQYEIVKQMQEAVQAAGELGDPLKNAKEAKAAVEELGKEVEKSRGYIARAEGVEQNRLAGQAESPLLTSLES